MRLLLCYSLYPSLLPFCTSLGCAIVFADVLEAMPLDDLVDWIMCGIFLNSGQVCSATSRLLVEKPLYDKLTSRLCDRARAIRCGDPLSQNTQMGPLVSVQQAKKVECVVLRSIEQGCVPLVGGERSGCFYPPTVLHVPSHCTNESLAWRDEIFGPVLCVTAFASEEEAVLLANASKYGLADAVFTNNENTFKNMRSKLQTGLVWHNCTTATTPWTPFGGKAGRGSGSGKEMGEAGLREYLSSKSSVAVKKNTNYGWKWYQ